MQQIGRKPRVLEAFIEKVLLVCASVSVLGVIFITIFIFQKGIPLFEKVGVLEFVFGLEWEPTASIPRFGIFPFIVGSFFVTFLSLFLAVPIGITTGIFLAEIAKGRAARIMRSVVELLAGIPSVVYGFFGIVVVSVILRNLFGGTGYNVLAASIILAIMVLPTIINITEVSLRAVPLEYKEGSYALGATQWQTIYHVIVPAARSGILTGIVLGMGRAIGETMAVLMVGGNAPIMPTGIFSKVRTLTMNVVTDMGYASGDHMTALFTTGIVLFVFIFVLNFTVLIFNKKALGKE